MIAYDFDGVVISDVVAPGEDFRKFIEPTFIPESPYAIISGRHWEGGLEDLHEWVSTWLGKNASPTICWVASVGEDPAAFKLRILENETSIDTYIESDLAIVEYLVANMKRKIRLLHFGTLIRKAVATPRRKIRELTYDEVEKYCLEISTRILWLPEDKRPECVIGVMRGGMFPAQVIAECLGVPLGVYYPNRRFYISDRDTYTRFLFVDDEVGLGRTFKEVSKFAESMNIEWLYATVLCDSEYNDDRIIHGIKTEDWVVMPWRRNRPQDVMEIGTGVRIYNRDRK